MRVNPLKSFVCKSVMKGSILGAAILVARVISLLSLLCQQKEEEVRLTLKMDCKLCKPESWVVFGENGIDTTDYFEKIKKEFESDSLIWQNYIL